jgi:putative membrane protein
VDELIGTFIGRWYVTLFGLTFLWRASRQLGWRKTGLFVLIALPLAIAAENGSVHAGFPYTTYSFNENLRGDELFVWDVPLMVPMSYTFMAYFAFAAGRLVASGPLRTRAPRAWHELLVAWMLGVWAIWILDPVSRLGSEFYLGELWQYRGPGFWFGLPLGSQLGFAATVGILVYMLHRLDRDAPDAPVPGGLRTHPHAVALLTYHAQVFHLVAVAFYLEADTIAGSGVLMWVPVACVTAVHWSQLRLRDREPRSERVDVTAPGR